MKYEPTEDPKHPGFGDQRYIARRAELNELANSYRHGEAIPWVEYTAEEHASKFWGNLWNISLLGHMANSIFAIEGIARNAYMPGISTKYCTNGTNWADVSANLVASFLKIK